MTSTERRELLDNLKDEIDEIDADIDGEKSTLEYLQEQLADTLREIKEAKEGIARMKAEKIELREQRKQIKKSKCNTQSANRDSI